MWEENYRIPSIEDMEAILKFLSFIEHNQGVAITVSEQDLHKISSIFIREMRKHAFTAGSEHGTIFDSDWQYLRNPQLIEEIDLPAIQRILTFMWRCYVHVRPEEPFLHNQEDRIVVLHILKRISVLRKEI